MAKRLTLDVFTPRVQASAASYDDHIVTVNALGADVSWLPMLLFLCAGEKLAEVTR